MPNYRLQIAVSVDGFIADKDGSVAFLEKYNDTGFDFEALISSFDLMIQGGVTYRQVLGFGTWPYGKVPHIVISREETRTPPGVDVRFHRGTVQALVRKLESVEGDIWLIGGRQTINSFIEAGVRPRLELAIVPELLGEGIRLFDMADWRGGLELVSTRTYGAGMVMMEYHPLRG